MKVITQVFRLIMILVIFGIMAAGLYVFYFFKVNFQLAGRGRGGYIARYGDNTVDIRGKLFSEILPSNGQPVEFQMSINDNMITVIHCGEYDSNRQPKLNVGEVIEVRAWWRTYEGPFSTCNNNPLKVFRAEYSIQKTIPL